MAFPLNMLCWSVVIFFFFFSILHSLVFLHFGPSHKTFLNVNSLHPMILPNVAQTNREGSCDFSYATWPANMTKGPLQFCDTGRKTARARVKTFLYDTWELTCFHLMYFQCAILIGYAVNERNLANNLVIINPIYRWLEGVFKYRYNWKTSYHDSVATLTVKIIWKHDISICFYLRKCPRSCSFSSSWRMAVFTPRY